MIHGRNRCWYCVLNKTDQHERTGGERKAELKRTKLNKYVKPPPLVLFSVPQQDIDSIIRPASVITRYPFYIELPHICRKLNSGLQWEFLSFRVTNGSGENSCAHRREAAQGVSPVNQHAVGKPGAALASSHGSFILFCSHVV